MLMDILVIVIFCLAVFLSMRRGFTLTVINFLKSIAAVVLGFLFYDDLRDFLLQRTSFGTRITERAEAMVGNSINSTMQDSSLYQLIPDTLRSRTDNITEALTSSWVNRIVSIAMAIFAFFLIFAAVMIVACIITHLFSRKYRGGFFGFMDWVLGGLLGIIIGAFYVFLFLALILPVTGFIMPNLSETLTNSLAASTFAKDLYDNNILLVIFKFL